LDKKLRFQGFRVQSSEFRVQDSGFRIQRASEQRFFSENLNPET
jgi:hypothetical protein